MYTDKLIVSIDAKDGYVAIKGWVNMSELSAYNFAKKIVDKGIKQLVYTDISRDGTLRGPNFDGVEKMCNIEGAKIIASGGVKDLGDLKMLKSIGVAGVIIGKALYNGNIDLKEALTI
jgi:phosphoribosylformimino-5-aminoimidazole carboxamide ribotide isomerase